MLTQKASVFFIHGKKANEISDLLRIKTKNALIFREWIVISSEQDFGNPPVTTKLHQQYKT